MGQEHVYSKPISEERTAKNETRVYRNPLSLVQLSGKPSPMMRTLQDIAENSFIEYGHRPFLGSREVSFEGALGQYK